MATGIFASGTGTTASAVMPSGASVGEQAIFVAGTRGNSQVSTSPGATWIPMNIVRSGTSSTQAAGAAYTKTVTSGDLGTTVSCSLVAAGPWCAVVITVPNLHVLHPVLRSITNIPLPAPVTLTPTISGTPGSTQYQYVCTAINEAGESIASSVMTTSVGPAVLSSTNFVKVRFNPVTAANNYNVYGRTVGGPYNYIGTCDNTNVGSSTSDQRRGVDDIGQTPTTQEPPPNSPLNVHWDGQDVDLPGRLTTNFTNGRVLHVAVLNAILANASLAVTSVPSGFTILGQKLHTGSRILLVVCLEDLTSSGDLLSGRLGAFNDFANWTAISAILRPKTANGPPVASAGIDYVGFSGDPVYLDANISSDLDGDLLAYNWSQTFGPSVVLTNANTATPSFTAPVGALTQVFRVTATDPSGVSSTDDVTITVTDPTNGTGSVTVPPVYKSVTTATAVSGTTPAIVLPNTGNGAAVGDLAILVLSVTPGLATDPTGWTPLAGTPTTATGSTGRLYVWTKLLQAGDLGSTLTLSLNSSSRSALACITTSAAIVDTTAKDETNTSGLSVIAPSVTPSVTNSLLVNIYGTVPNAGGDQPTWTADPTTSERADVVSANGSSHNATLLVDTQDLTSAAATGVRTATPSLAVQRQGISLVVVTPQLAIRRQTALSTARPISASQRIVIGSTGQASSTRPLTSTRRAVVGRVGIVERARGLQQDAAYVRWHADWHDTIAGGTAVVKDFLNQIENTFARHDAQLNRNQAVGPVVRVIDGVPTDADFAVAPSDGTLAINSATNSLYLRLGGTWRPL